MESMNQTRIEKLEQDENVLKILLLAYKSASVLFEDDLSPIQKKEAELRMIHLCLACAENDRWRPVVQNSTFPKVYLPVVIGNMTGQMSLFSEDTAEEEETVKKKLLKPEILTESKRFIRIGAASDLTENLRIFAKQGYVFSRVLQIQEPDISAAPREAVLKLKEHPLWTVLLLREAEWELMPVCFGMGIRERDALHKAFYES